MACTDFQVIFSSVQATFDLIIAVYFVRRLQINIDYLFVYLPRLSHLCLPHRIIIIELFFTLSYYFFMPSLGTLGSGLHLMLHVSIKTFLMTTKEIEVFCASDDASHAIGFMLTLIMVCTVADTLLLRRSLCLLYELLGSSTISAKIHTHLIVVVVTHHVEARVP
jgi:hypothetical protein